MGPDAMIFIFWMLSFKPAFSLSSFSFIKKELMLSAIKMVSSAYLRLLIFFPSNLVSEECNFLGSILLKQRFETADQCYSTVTAQSFIWQTKDSTLWRCEGGQTPKKRPQPILAPSFYTFLSSPPPQPHPAASHMQIRSSQEGGMFVSPEVLTPVRGYFLCSLFVGFSHSLSFSTLPCASSSPACHMMYSAWCTSHLRQKVRKN